MGHSCFSGRSRSPVRSLPGAGCRSQSEAEAQWLHLAAAVLTTCGLCYGIPIFEYIIVFADPPKKTCVLPLFTLTKFSTLISTPKSYRQPDDAISTVINGCWRKLWTGRWRADCGECGRLQRIYICFMKTRRCC